MTLQNQNKLAKHILRLLKVQELIIPICRTSKGNFGFRYGSNTEEYEMYLDAVPLSTKDILNDENNIELKKMLEKYLFEQAPLSYQGMPIIRDTKEPKLTMIPLDLAEEAVAKGLIPKEDIVAQDKPKRGRPAGSKNKQNVDDTPKETS